MAQTNNKKPGVQNKKQAGGRVQGKRVITTNRSNVGKKTQTTPKKSSTSNGVKPGPKSSRPRQQSRRRSRSRVKSRGQSRSRPTSQQTNNSSSKITQTQQLRKQRMLKQKQAQQNQRGGAKQGSNLKLQTAVRQPKQEPKEGPKYTQLRTKKIPVCYYAKQGPRDYMEDTYQIMHFDINGKSGTFYGVFDGHGGKDVSYECVHMSRGLFPFLIENIKRARGADIPKIIKSSFLEYDKILYKRKLNAGSTAIVILNFNGKMYLINLGDSRGMIFTKEDLIAVSDDHKPQKATERTRIYKAGHFVNPFRIFKKKPSNRQYGDIFDDPESNKQYIYLHGKWEPITTDQFKQVRDMTVEGQEDTTRVSNSLALSRAFGDFYLKTDHNNRYMGPSSAVSMIPDVITVDIRSPKLRGKDIYVFLASDGFWDVNRNTQGLRKAMANHSDPQKFCKELVDISYDKGSQDNTTVVLDKIDHF
tara:strand:+ start:1916 stop:3334 length:1419 start_codon:yes stop_codon:yes gene_type:complete